ncbi:MAG: metallophosphoesterase [Proteobacteria bacterium]|nr:metallophosphoesterase [Pseudomonadota bacterium]
MAMLLFISTFILIYGGINYYCFRLVDKSLGLNKIKKAILFVFILLMTLSPIIVGILLRKGHIIYIKEYVWLTYYYLAFVTLLFCVSICFRLLMFIARNKNNPLMNLKVSSFLAISLCFYGYFEANNIKIENIEIYSNKINRNLKIAFLSDLHHGHTVSDEYVSNIIKKLKEERIDLLLMGGDILETGWNNNAKIWNEINPPLGKFAVSGNHEFYLGYEKSKIIYGEMGVKLIDNQSLDIGELNLIGLPDEVYVTQYSGYIEDINKLRKKLPETKFTILLKHRPRKVYNGLIDLQLSGHTHSGQILPFKIITKMFYPIHSGLYNVDGDYKIYVSRGIGTWGPRIRVVSSPELTIINLIKKD